MKLFHKKKEPLPIPEPFTAADIKVEASTCTGERTIGFYDRKTHRLRCAELMRSEQDIRNFYEKYGIPAEESAVLK